MRPFAIAFGAVVIAVCVWLALSSLQDTADVTDELPIAPASPSAAIEAEPQRARAPEAPVAAPVDYRIEEGTRLALDAASLPAGGVVTLGVALEAEALGGGDDPLSAVVVSADDGRRLELSATPVVGQQSGARLEVESAWLQPGLYMIQIRTAEKNPFPVRRYVVEVGASSRGPQ